MKEAVLLLDPTSERSPAIRQRLKRPADLREVVIGLLDISKPRGDVFLDELERLLTWRGLQIKRFRKPTYTRVAPLELKQEIRSQCRAVIEALAD